jgi:hypothetical protein
MAGGLANLRTASALILAAATLVAFSAMVTCLALVGMVALRRRERWAVVAPLALTPLAAFPPTLITALAVLVLLLAFAFYVWMMAREARARIRFSFDKTIRVDLAATISLVIVAVSVLSYGQVSRQGSDPDQVLKRLTSSTTGILERVLPLTYPQYDSAITVDEFIRRQLPDAKSVLADLRLDALKSREARRQVLEQKLRDLGVDPATVDVNAYLNDADRAQAELEQAIDRELASLQDETVQATREQLSRNFRVDLAGDDHLADALERIVAQNVDRYVRPYAGAVPAVLALSLFFLLSLFVYVYELAVRGAGQILFHALKAGGAVRVSRETVEAERLTLT